MILGWETQLDRDNGAQLMKDLVTEGLFSGYPRLLSAWEILIKHYEGGTEDLLRDVADLIPLGDTVNSRNKSGSGTKADIAGILDLYFNICTKGQQTEYIIHFARKSPRLVLKKRLLYDHSVKSSADEGKCIHLPDSGKSEHFSEVDYIISKEDVQKEILFLSDQMELLKNEKESAELLGITGSATAVSSQIRKNDKRLELLKSALLRIENGYEFWNKSSFKSECVEGGFECYPDMIGEIADGIFLPNPESETRIPMSRHLMLREAIDSKLFTKIIVYPVIECNYSDDENSFCLFHLFGTSNLVENALFLIATWSLSDM